MELWLIFAALAAVFAALTTVLAKIGLKQVDSNLVTAIRTIVVLVFACIMVFVVGSQHDIKNISLTTWLLILLSGLTAGGSWLCFFRALKLGKVKNVIPIDKSSTVLTMLLAFAFLGEPISLIGAIGMGLMGVGTWLMLELKKESLEENIKKSSKSWLLWAILAAVFASLTAIFGRVGVADLDATLWTALRTTVIVPLSWLVVFLTKGQKKIGKINRKNWFFLISSGVTTGVSWLFFYHALQLGNTGHVVAIDKLSIVLTMIFARMFLGEKLSKKSTIGLILLTGGTLLATLLG